MVYQSVTRVMVGVALFCLSGAAASGEAAASGVASRNSPLRKLDNADLTDLLDAPLDEAFLERNLQEFMTESPTPTPGDMDREIDSTSAPTIVGFTNGPAQSATVAPTEISGAGSWRPASASTAIAAIVLVGSYFMV